VPCSWCLSRDFGFIGELSSRITMLTEIDGGIWLLNAKVSQLGELPEAKMLCAKWGMVVWRKANAAWALLGLPAISS
jgi:hypothetical protein